MTSCDVAAFQHPAVGNTVFGLLFFFRSVASSLLFLQIYDFFNP